MPRQRAPELSFQQHVADFLVRVHGYGVLEQAEISASEHCIAEEQLWAFLQATQAEQLQTLANDYSSDAREEVFRALRKELDYTPLWMILRHGLQVRGLAFRLYYPMPRSAESAAASGHRENRITFRPHFYFGETHQEIDFVVFLNGLPIVALELKHEKNQTVHDAVAQFAARDHAQRIFQHPFLYLAADTSDVMAASDPRRVENFRWHNSGLTNTAQTPGEYPVEFLYREVLAKEQLLEMLSFFLVRVVEREAEDDRRHQAAFTILPRYHQSRMVRKVADDALAHFTACGNVGRKYLIHHSAGSGKTLSICWLADRLHSLFKAGSNEKLVNVVFVLTDRKSLDTNIRADIEKFTHLQDVVGLARKADDLPRFLRERKAIIVTTQQKFAWVLEQIENDPALKTLRVAFLIDEAHRSQEGQMGVAIRMPFRRSDSAEAAAPAADDETDDAGDEAAANEADEEQQIARIIREHDVNQIFVAFSATPAPATVTLFGAPFDSYSEAEAIAEGYIVDVAASIISYRTLYNLYCPLVRKADDERLYPAGVVSKALQNAAFQDDGLIQYKAEVMLRIFEADVKPLIGNRAKAMIVASSRVAGLRYFRIIQEKLRERGADYKVLYAFSDFVHPQTNAAVSEHAVNQLNDGELIEDRFEGEDYRLMIVANKFQTGFDQPLLAGMFLDKPVVDRNAVQTVSRLNRRHEGKSDVIVVDFTNNARAILGAFAKYRKGTPFEPEEPDPELCAALLARIIEAGVFTQGDARGFVALAASGTDAQMQLTVNALRVRFQARLTSPDDRKNFVYLLARLVKHVNFLTCFFTLPADVREFVVFAEYVGPQLIKQGSISELMHQIHQTEVIRAAVRYNGEVRSGGEVKLRRGGGGRKGVPPPLRKVSITEMIDEILGRCTISDDEALFIRQVTEQKAADPTIRSTVQDHRQDLLFLEGAYRRQVNGEIRVAYRHLERYEALADAKYTDTGGIFDIMAVTVIDTHLQAAA
ncbi:MAG: type I restriction endonuclease subunit R [Candidatus Accumulibacter sp.]|nr:type I restriction endonuclease subunit R [Accumulibacter sp.]MCB1964719.1 type I restriction endonuclease subunit R [Accumulibacter sp.]